MKITERAKLSEEALEKAMNAYEEIFYTRYCREICQRCHNVFNKSQHAIKRAVIMGQDCPLIRYEAYLYLVAEHGNAYASEHLTSEAIKISQRLISQYHSNKNAPTLAELINKHESH